MIVYIKILQKCISKVTNIYVNLGRSQYTEARGVCDSGVPSPTWLSVKTGLGGTPCSGQRGGRPISTWNPNHLVCRSIRTRLASSSLPPPTASVSHHHAYRKACLWWPTTTEGHKKGHLFAELSQHLILVPSRITSSELHPVLGYQPITFLRCQELLAKDADQYIT